MLIRSTHSTVKSIPNLIRNQSTLTSSSTTSNSSTSNSFLPIPLSIAVYKAALFGPAPPFPAYLATKDNYRSTYLDQGWRESKRRGYEGVNRVERNGVNDLKKSQLHVGGWRKGIGGVKMVGNSRRGFSTSALLGATPLRAKSSSIRRDPSILQRSNKTKLAPAIQKPVRVNPILTGQSKERKYPEKKLPPNIFASTSGPKAGDWIETRSNGSVTTGIILGVAPDDTTRSVLLTSVSTVTKFAPNDITFLIPSLVSPTLATAAFNPTAHLDSIVTPTKAMEFASHKIIQELRQLETRVEDAKIDLVQLGAGELYRHFTATGSTARSSLTTHFALTTLYAPRPVPGVTPPSQPVRQYNKSASLTSHKFSTPPPQASVPLFTTQIYLLAMHQILIEQPIHFVCDPLSHRTSSRFSIRPIGELESFELVRGWLRTRSKEMLAFAEKAVKAVDWGKHFSQTMEQQKERVETPSSLAWSQSDLEIIQFLRLSLTSQRLLQLQPYLSISPGILKLFEEFQRKLHPTSLPLASTSTIITSTDLDTTTPFLKPDRPLSKTGTDHFNRERIMHFLSSIGIVPPWENWAAHAYTPLVARSNSNSFIDIAAEKAYDARLPYSDGLDSVRKDFGALKVYTIDDAGAMELDDGISLEEVEGGEGIEKSWWIHVHVADPTSVLAPEHEVAQMAKERYQTIYLPEKTFPMLPDWFLEKEKLSLGSNRGEEGGGKRGEQKVLTFSTRVNEEGKVLETEVKAGIVRDVRRLTYAAVDEVLGFEKGPNPIVLTLSSSNSKQEEEESTSESPTRRQTDDASLTTDASAVADLRQLHRLAKAVLKKRAHRALYWSFPSSNTSVSPSLSHQFSTLPEPTFYSSPPSISLTLPVASNSLGELTYSQTIVSEFMVLANRTAARFCAERGVPALYRSQVAPKTDSKALETVLALRDPDTGLVRGEDVLKFSINFEAAVTTTHPLPHWPMGIHDQFGYVKVTSPLRRYSDMLCHWQIKSALLPTSSPSAPSTNSTTPSTIATLPAPRLGISKNTVELLVTRFDSSERAQKNLDRSGQSFWAHYLLKQKLALSPGVDPVADEVLSNLTCLGLRTPVFSLVDGNWSQRVLIMELGIRGQIELGYTSGEKGPAVGETARCQIREIILSENPRCLVTLKK